MEDIDSACQDAVNGSPSRRPIIEMTIPSVLDKTISPPGTSKLFFIDTFLISFLMAFDSSLGWITFPSIYFLLYLNSRTSCTNCFLYDISTQFRFWNHFSALFSWCWCCLLPTINKEICFGGWVEFILLKFLKLRKVYQIYHFRSRVHTLEVFFIYCIMLEIRWEGVIH